MRTAIPHRVRTSAGDDKPTILGRRPFLRATLASGAAAVVGTQVGGFPASSRQTGAELELSPDAATPTGSRILLAYFSRAGENYHYGGRIDLEIGNTEVLAGMIVGLIGCDVHRIEPADPYSDDYDETVARNVSEQDADARPGIANPLASIVPYDIVLLGSPIWNVRPPMIMATFAEGFDFTGKTIFPFTTHAMSGMGNAERVYREACRGATFGEGLAVQGEQVIDDPDAAVASVEDWLRRIGLPPASSATPAGR